MKYSEEEIKNLIPDLEGFEETFHEAFNYYSTFNFLDWYYEDVPIDYPAFPREITLRQYNQMVNTFVSNKMEKGI